jgi:hypothetical protein
VFHRKLVDSKKIYFQDVTEKATMELMFNTLPLFSLDFFFCGSHRWEGRIHPLYGVF